MSDEKTVMASEMTLKDYFAAKAMAAIIASKANGVMEIDPDYEEFDYGWVADQAYAFADEMIKMKKHLED